jgi:MFS family permease
VLRELPSLRHLAADGEPMWRRAESRDISGRILGTNLGKNPQTASMHGHGPAQPRPSERVDAPAGQLLPGLLLLSTTAAAVPIGLIGSRFGRKRVIAAGYLGMGLAAMAGLFIMDASQGAILFLVAGLANAAPVVLTVPLMADLVPRHHFGKATGLLAASGSIAAPLSSLVAGFLADLYGPRAIFGVMAAALLLTGVRVRHSARLTVRATLVATEA